MDTFTLQELADSVREWCEERRIVPANGQVAEEITERTIRYYRTLGLLDVPSGTYSKAFGEKHRLQLISIRLLQAQGLPLRKIRDLLYGKSLADLRALEKQGWKLSTQTVPQFASASPQETWNVIPLTPEFLLVSRSNRPVPKSVAAKVAQLLSEFTAVPVGKH